jgi:hypothetical protein
MASVFVVGARIALTTMTAAANPEAPMTAAMSEWRNHVRWVRRKSLSRSNRAFRAATNRGGGSIRIF